MNSATSINIILGIIMFIKNLKKGFMANFYLDIPKTELWIKSNLLFYEVIGDSAFLCRRNQEFNNLFYISTDTKTLDQDLDIFCNRYSNELFVVDIIGSENDIKNIKNIFNRIGFYQYTLLIRMSKVSNENCLFETDSKFITYADTQKVNYVFDLLQHYFDPYAEQLPLIEEINTWISNNGILIYSDDNQTIQGFLIYELIGQTSYLRYWFVHPDHREKKIGSTLLRSFFAEGRATKRQLFWVIESNDNAIKRYEHYGFKKEKLIDCIMINKNICYGG